MKKLNKVTATVNRDTHAIIASFHEVTDENNRFELTTATNTTKNNVAVDELLTRVNILNSYIEHGICCTHDTSGYCGIDNGRNNTIVFSPNYKKTLTNIYCSDTVFDILSKCEFVNSQCTRNSNSVSNTIPNTIVCKSLNDFKLMLTMLVNHKLVRMLPTTNN